jgi:UDPglucose 6-dehydrogenase
LATVAPLDQQPDHIRASDAQEASRGGALVPGLDAPEVMKVTVIGTGYVGLVTGACLSEMGNHVVCLDVDARKIKMLNDGGIPIFEPGLKEMVQRNAAAGRLQFTTDVDAAVAHGTLQFIGVGTPPDEDGSADLQYVLAAAAASAGT